MWLWASCAIAVPVIIHLWNVRHGRTLKVGNISLYTANAKAHARSLKLSELLLLVLRCLLLIIMAIILSNPYRVEELDLSKEKGWVLIEKESMSEAYDKCKPAIDSLLAKGYMLHYFNPGFKKTTLKEALAIKADSLPKQNISYWTLIKSLNQQVPAKLPVYLFTDNRLSRLEGTRPYIAVNLKWITYTSRDAASSWVHNVYETIKDSLLVISGESHASGIKYSSGSMESLQANKIPGLAISPDKMSITYKNNPTGSSITIPVDTSTYNIYVYTDRSAADANYLMSAFYAIREFTQRKIKATLVADIQKITGSYEWLFWLSENDIPERLLKGNVLLYEKGKLKKLRSGLVMTGPQVASPEEEIQFYKLIENNNPPEEVVLWKNGYGDAILSADKNNPSIFHFYNRFNPQWNDLTWNSSFPQILFTLMFTNRQARNTMLYEDKRTIDPLQLRPTIVDQSKLLPKEKLVKRTDLSNILWIIAFTLLALERAISYKRKKNKLYG